MNMTGVLIRQEATKKHRGVGGWGDDQVTIEAEIGETHRQRDIIGCQHCQK